MKRLTFVLLCLIPVVALASNVLVQTMAVTTSASTSSQLPFQSNIIVQCDVDVYVKQTGLSTGDDATGTNGLKLTAGNVYSTDTVGGYRYVSIKSVSSSGNCQILRTFVQGVR